jgi:hypothetical protein
MRRAPALCGVLGCVVAGCTADDPAATGCGVDDVAAVASDVVVVTNVEASLYFAVADAVSLNPADPSAAPVAAAAAKYFPRGCATATADQNFVTFQFNDCSGPLGLTHVAGTVTAGLSSDGAGALGITLTGDDIAADGGVFILNTSATVYADSGSTRMLMATSMSNGTGPEGQSVDHSGNFTLRWSTGARCATLNASLQGITTGDHGPAAMTITDFVTCTGACPSAGIAIDQFQGGSVRLDYDGAPFAFCSANNGTSAAIGLLCP